MPLLRLTAALALPGLLLSLVLIGGAPSYARAQQGTVQLSADRTDVGLGEQLRVRVQISASGGQGEYVPPTFEGFNVVQRHENPIPSFNVRGGATSFFRFDITNTYVLTPTEQGTVTVGPAKLSIGARTVESNTLTINVSEGTGVVPTTPGQQGPPPGPITGAEYEGDAFLRSVVANESPFVGEQVTVTVYLYVRRDIVSEPVVHQEPAAEGFWVHGLLEPNRRQQRYRQMVNGTPFEVHVFRRFAAFPLREGELQIGPMEMTVEVGNYFRREALRRTGVPIKVQVQPLPEAERPAGRISVGRYTLEASVDRSQIATGDAVSVTATARGTGNVRDLELELPELAGLRILPPEIRDQVQAPNDQVAGTRTWRWLVVPEQPGEYELGALTLATFDAIAERYVAVRSDPLRIVAAGNAPTIDDDGPSPNPTSEAGADEPDLGPVRTESELDRDQTSLHDAPWFFAALAAPPLLWLALMLVSLLRRRRAGDDERHHKRALRDARRQLNDAQKKADQGEPREFYSAVRQSLLSLLSARLGEPVGGYTHAELRSHLVGRGMDKVLANRVVDEVEGSEFARFSAAGSSPEEMKSCAKRVTTLASDIERFRPRKEAA